MAAFLNPPQEVRGFPQCGRGLGCTFRAQERSSLLQNSWYESMARLTNSWNFSKSVAYWIKKQGAWQCLSKARPNNGCDPMAQDGFGSDALIRPQNIAKAASAEQITAGKVVPLKGQNGSDGGRWARIFKEVGLPRCQWFSEHSLVQKHFILQVVELTSSSLT
jgi:hypothetical protein